MPKISLLPDNSSLVDADIVPVVQNTDTTPVTKKVSAAEIKTYAQTGLLSSSISDFVEAAQDAINSLLVEGTGIDLTYVDGSNTLTIAVSGITASLVSDFSEAVDDRINALLVEGTGIDLTYNDGSNTLTIAITTHSHTSSDISDFAEAVDDRVNILLVGGTDIDITYNDGANTITIDSTASVGGGGITADEADPRFLYHPSGGTLLLSKYFAQDGSDDFSEVTPASGTAVFEQGRGVLSVVCSGQDFSDAGGIVYWPLELDVGQAVETHCRAIFPNSNYPQVGVIVLDDSVSPFKAMSTGFLQSDGQSKIIFANAGVTSDLQSVASGGAVIQTGFMDSIFIRLVREDSDTWLTQVSDNGVQWVTYASTDYSITPSHVGLWASTRGSGDIVGSWNYCIAYDI